MFNQQLFVQHLKEVETGNITPTEFAMLCWMNNDVQLNDSDVIERHTIYFAERVNISDRQAQRLFNSLSDKGFINIVRRGTKRNRKPNVFRLYNDMNVAKKTDETDVYNDIYNDMDVTPRKTNKKTNKIKHSKHSTCTKANSTCSVLENKDNQNRLEEDMNETKKTETAENSSMPCANDYFHNDETVKSAKPTSEEVKQRNQYVTSTWEKLDQRLNRLITIKDKPTFEKSCEEILCIFEDAMKHEDWFTDAQWTKHQVYVRRFLSIKKLKAKDFVGKGNTKRKDESISIEPEQEEYADAEHTSMDTEQSQSAIVEPSKIAPPQPEKRKCGPFTREQAIEWAKSTVAKYDTYEEWQNAMTKRFNKVYGDWDFGKDPNACRLWNIVDGYASDYYWNRSEEQAKKEMEMDAAFDELIKESGADEIINVSEQKMNDEEWHEKYGHLLKH